MTFSNEIEQLKEDIAILQEKLQKLEELEKLKNTKPKTLTDLIHRWWEDIFSLHSDWDSETSIDDLVDQIELFLPKEQSANSQNTYVELTVEGFNDAIKQIKSKLR